MDDKRLERIEAALSAVAEYLENFGIPPHQRGTFGNSIPPELEPFRRPSTVKAPQL